MVGVILHVCVSVDFSSFSQMTLNPLLSSDAVGNREQCLKSFLVSLLLFLS